MSKSPSITRPAATMLLLRDGATELEVLMVLRNAGMSFQSALVFPGGKVDPEDNAPDLNKHIDGADAVGVEGLAARIAAIRETFEEAGVLLARYRSETELIDPDRLLHLRKRYRRAMIENTASLLDMAKAEDLVLACDRLVHFAHWIPPQHVPVRFDTHFFLASMPTAQQVVHDGSETLDTEWLNPLKAINQAEAGTHTIVFPTRMNLAKLGRSQDVASALETARTARVVTVQPVIEDRPEGKMLCIPADAGYDITAIPFKEVPRATFPGA